MLFVLLPYALIHHTSYIKIISNVALLYFILFCYCMLSYIKYKNHTGAGKSFIMACQADLPLGILLGEHEELPGAIRVDEVAANSNGEQASVQEGDLLRACTACQQTMETPTWQLLAGGIGQPKTKRFMFATDGRPFEEVMEAVASNRMDPEGRPVWLVLERPE